MALSRAMSSAGAGLRAYNTGIDVVGNNVANINTAGFKGSRITFSDSLYQTLSSASKSGYTSSSDTGAAGRNPMQIGYGSSASAIQVDTGSPGFTSTGVGTDCYIEGDGYFVASTGYDSTKKVPTGLEYTRVGQLTFDDAGFLTDGKNRILGNNSLSAMGTALTDSSKPTALATDGNGHVSDPTKIGYIYYDPTKNSLSNVSVGADGTVTAKDAASGKIVTVGQIFVARFDNPGALKEDGNSYYEPTDNSGVAEYAAPGTGNTGSLRTGAIEASNVDLATEFSNMIVYERGFQANSKLISVSDEMLQTLVNMKS